MCTSRKFKDFVLKNVLPLFPFVVFSSLILATTGLFFFFFNSVCFMFSAFSLFLFSLVQKASDGGPGL